MKTLKVIQDRLKDELADQAEYNTAKEIILAMEGKQITARIEGKLPAKWKMSRDHINRITLITPRTKITLPKVATEAGLDELNIPYSKGTPERISKLQMILNNPEKLKSIQRLTTALHSAYKKLKATMAELREEHGSHENPAFYQLFEGLQYSSISDIYYDKIN